MFHLELPAVTGAHEAIDQFRRVELISDANDDRFDLGDVGPETLDERPHRRHDDARCPLRIAQMPEGAETPTHGFHGRTHPLERKRLPRRKEIHLVGTEERSQVAGQTLGLAGRGDGDHDRLAIGPMGQPCDGDGPRRLGNSKDRIAAAEYSSKSRFVDEELWQVGEGHRFFRRRRKRLGGVTTRKIPGRCAYRGWREESDSTDGFPIPYPRRHISER